MLPRPNIKLPRLTQKVHLIRVQPGDAGRLQFESDVRIALRLPEAQVSLLGVLRIGCWGY